MDGWIKLHKKLLEWEWWNDHNVTRLFIYLLLKANYEDKKWRGDVIKKGQLATGLHSLSESTGLSIQNLRTCLRKLEHSGEITKKSTNEYTLITIVSWDKYQSTDSTVTNDQQTINKRSTTTKEYKEIKNIIPTVDKLQKNVDKSGKKRMKSMQDMISSYRIPENKPSKLKNYWQEKALYYAQRLDINGKDRMILFKYFKSNLDVMDSICRNILSSSKQPKKPMALILWQWKQNREKKKP